MERGDIAVVALAILLVALLTAFFSHGEAGAPATPVLPTPAATTPVPPAPVSGTQPTPFVTVVPATEVPTPRITTRRIFYTGNFYLLPVRFIPGDMTMYGYSDVEWKYNSSRIFAYVEENHGGITESFTVPYPIWRMTSTLSATRTPEKARFRMILVDEQTGKIIEGTEIRYPGAVTKTVVARGRPLYMVIAAENVELFTITLEAPSEFVE